MAEIDPKAKEDVMSVFNADKRVIKLKQKMANAMHYRDYVTASRIGRQLEELKESVFQNLLAEAEEEKVEMCTLMGCMTDEDRANIALFANAIIFMSDAIESFSMEMETILKKHYPTYSIEVYDSMIQLGKQAKTQMEYMARVTDSVYQLNFADYADELQGHVLNKVRAMLRKTKEKAGCI